MTRWKYIKCCDCWNGGYYKLWIFMLFLLVCLHVVNGQCKDGPFCSFMAFEGECELDPENNLIDCPRACKNPCLCLGISTDTACDCLVKAKNGYCDDPAAMIECQSTCTKVTHDLCPLLPVPVDPNAKLSTWANRYLTVVTEICNLGFTPLDPDNQGMKTCSAGPKWVEDVINGQPVECIPVDCGNPPSSPNTFHVATVTTYGSTVSYTCAQGYVQIQGQLTLTCNASGLWEGQVLICKRLDCGQPPPSPNSTFKVTTTGVGGIASYTCAVGFRRVQGDTSLSCNSSGLWQGNLIVCKEVDCGTPPSVPNTQVVVTNMTYGNTANYTCVDGYILVQGQTSLTCNATGVWVPAPPVCSKIDCAQPPSMTNTNLVVNGTLYGDTANYTCAAGYSYVQGNTTLTCGTSSRWEGVPITCQKIDCRQPPSVSNTILSVNNTLYGDTANYTCATGYEHILGDVTLTCRTNGSWEGVIISCQRIDCGPPPSAPNVNLSVSTTFYGDTANYACLTGYQHVQGNTTLTCGAMGSWEGSIIKCQQINCSQPPTASNANVIVTGTLYGDTANYTCAIGYEMASGDTTLNCGIHGTWDGIIIMCQRIDCGPPPSAPNANLSVSTTFYGDTANYACVTGYQHVQGNTTLTCGAMGSWEGIIIKCQQINCSQPPTASNANVIVTGTLYGDTANYTCAIGYEMASGDTTLNCGIHGTWDGLIIVCQRIDCGPPPSAPNANLSVSTTFYGDTANYACVTGYQHVQGNTTLTCGAMGSWEGIIIKCQQINCSQPPTASNANVIVTGTLYGDTANYTCAIGYEMASGDTTLNCGLQGNWDGIIIMCQRIDCGPPPSAPNANLSVSSTFYGDTTNYTCVTGYQHVKGDTTLTCGAMGSWKGVVISCQKIDCGQPPSLTNVNVAVTDTFFGNTANYTCATGYRYVHGDTTLICGTSGSWEGVPITCKYAGVDCGAPPTSPNAVLKVNGTFYNDTATYACAVGYKYHQGDTTLICGISGSWKGTTIICLQIDCGPPNGNNLSSISVTSTTYGSQAFYTCIAEHERQSGDYRRTCLQNETWSGTALSCTPSSSQQPPTSSHNTIEAPAAWAIGVAIFAILATLIVLFVILDFGVLRKHSKHMKKNVHNFRKEVAHSLPSFRAWVKWTPKVPREGSLVPVSPNTLPDLSPAPSIRSRPQELQSANLAAEPSQAKSTYLTVSSSPQRLSPSTSTLSTPRSSLSIPNSPSSITLSSLSEPDQQNPMPSVGF